MNTQILQHHLETSLTDLARVCQTHCRTDACDQLVLRILADVSPDDAHRLCYIQEIDSMKEELCPKKELHIELNLKAFYEQGSDEWDRKEKVCKGLQTIAGNVSGGYAEMSSMGCDGALDFLYRSLCALGNPDKQGEIMKEIEIVAGLSSC